jgi:hypothetical protein
MESRALSPAFSCEKPTISGLFQTFFPLFDLGLATLLSKVRFLPDESKVPVFLMEGNFYEQERTGFRCR